MFRKKYELRAGKEHISFETNRDGAVHRAYEEARKRNWDSPPITVHHTYTAKSPFEIKCASMDVVRDDMELW